jgi:motility quorum-sensing regulator/GCU-specific mRNA interferase toxin
LLRHHNGAILPAWRNAGPRHDLDAFKAAVAAVFTRTAVRDARALGLGSEEMKTALSGLRRGQFYKSMTAVHDPRAWQDGYHLPWEGTTLYVKFTVSAGLVLLSFKEK